VLYMQVDVIFRGGAFFPGYPQSNFNWKPLEPQIRNNDRWVIEGAHKAPSVLYHETGHGQRFSKFTGGTEAAVNFPYVYVMNKGYGVPLDEAFGKSFRGPNPTINQAAIDRMISETFRAGEPANTTNKPGDEVKYQFRGYAIYADIARLFGWQPLVDFWAQDQKNYIAKKNYNFQSGWNFPIDINRDPTDNRILRLSIAAGKDLSPLAHFWGRHPEDPAKLKQAMINNKLKPSAKIYDLLQQYRKLVPMTNTDFVKHAKFMYPKLGSAGKSAIETNPKFGLGLYNTMAKTYDEKEGEKARSHLDSIIKLYFPNGRPSEFKP